MNQEIELKLSFPRAALAQLRDHPVIRATARCDSIRSLDNIYYDTPSCDLKTHGIALRTRQQGRLRLQTVKCAAVSTAGLAQRPEWEYPYNGTFNFAPINQPEVIRTLTRYHDQLIPILQTRFRRETFRYTPHPGTTILLMIDTGRIRANKRTAPICELELELETGPVTDLLQLAETLAQDLPLQPADQSKAERGYRLFLNLPPIPVDIVLPDLSPDLTPPEAFRQQALACLQHWQANTEMLAATKGRYTPEKHLTIIMQIHHALQRLQALLQLFSTTLPAVFTDPWLQRLQTLSIPFEQAARYTSIHEALFAPLHSAHIPCQEPARSRLINTAEKEYRQFYITAARASRSHEYGLARLSLLSALHCLPSGSNASALPQTHLQTHPLKQFASERLSHQHKTLLFNFNAISTSPPANPDALRQSLDLLHHSLFFLSSLLPKKKGKRYRNELDTMLTRLTRYNTLDQASPLLDEWQEKYPAHRVPIAFLLGWHSARQAIRTPRLLKHLHHFLQGTPPWKKDKNRE